MEHRPILANRKVTYLQIYVNVIRVINQSRTFKRIAMQKILLKIKKKIKNSKNLIEKRNIKKCANLQLPF